MTSHKLLPQTQPIILHLHHLRILVNFVAGERRRNRFGFAIRRAKITESLQPVVKLLQYFQKNNEHCRRKTRGIVFRFVSFDLLVSKQSNPCYFIVIWTQGKKCGRVFHSCSKTRSTWTKMLRKFKIIKVNCIF